MIYFTSDHHFEHQNIISYCKRGYVSAQEMNEDLIHKWNSIITNGDTVYYLGDFGLGPKDHLTLILARLKRRKIVLIRGNHDKSKTAMLDIGFDEVHDYLDLNTSSKKLLLVHRPMITAYHDIVLCGHVHDKFKITENIYNVGVDVNNFVPVSIDEILTNNFTKNSNRFQDLY